MTKNRLTQLLGIQYPIFQGGMAWVAEANLASAVSNGGGLGIIAGGNVPTEILRTEIRKCKALTNKPFAVNIMLQSENVDEIAEMVVEEGVKVLTTGAGNPGKYMSQWQEAGMIVIPVVASVAMAKRMERSGADAVIVEGTEAGGHVGELTTMALMPQVVDVVNIPVIAAGGIADGRGVVAAFALGASGIQVGTRFVVATESIAHHNFKQAILDAKDTDTAVTGRGTNHPTRCIKNQMLRKVMKAEKEEVGTDPSEIAGKGALRRAVIEGDLANGSLMAGQIAGLVTKEQSAKEIIAELFADAKSIALEQLTCWQETSHE